MKKYVIKETQINLETLEQNVFYTGTDGYVHDSKEDATGYKKLGMCVNRKDTDMAWVIKFYKGTQLKDNVVFDGKWIHHYEIVEVEQEDE